MGGGYGIEDEWGREAKGRAIVCLSIMMYINSILSKSWVQASIIILFKENYCNFNTIALGFEKYFDSRSILCL